jgi:hypothetical protein
VTTDDDIKPCGCRSGEAELAIRLASAFREMYEREKQRADRLQQLIGAQS